LSAIPEHSARIKELAVESGLERTSMVKHRREFEITVDGKPVINERKELKTDWERALPESLTNLKNHLRSSERSAAEDHMVPERR